MPFEKNLQILRARKNMTQEQLAEELGVSRQSVSKWESGASFPELATLLALCDLYDVTLDDLLRGSVEQDVAGDTQLFDVQMNRFARSVSTGVGLVLLGIAAAAGLDGFGVPEHFVGMVFFLFLVVAVMLLVSAGLEDSAFFRRHPVLRPRYKKEEQERAERRFIRVVTGAVGTVLGSLAVVAGLSFLEDTHWEELLGTFFMLGLTAAVAPLVYAALQKSKYEKAEALCRAADGTALPPAPEQEKQAKRKELAGRICGCIMLLATAVFLAWSLPLHFLESPVWKISWVVFPIGAVLCGVVSVALGAD